MSWGTLANLLGVGRATVVDDTGELQELQVNEKAYGSGFADRILDKVRRLTEFGFTSVPPVDAEVVMLRFGADRGASVVIATSHRPSRPRNLKPGDTAVYDVRGAILKFTETGTLLDCAGLPLVIQNASKITLDSPEIDITGDLKVVGNIVLETGGTSIDVKALHDAYNAHKHTGVQTGDGSTGTTDQTA